MKYIVRFMVLASLLFGTNPGSADAGSVSSGCRHKAGTIHSSQHPQVVIYSTPWCANCRDAAAYMKKNDIPFVKKDVDSNENYLEELETRYGISAVPVIVIGQDEKILMGFIPEVFQNALKDVMVKRRHDSNTSGR